MRVEVAVMGSPSLNRPGGFRGCKATLKRSCPRAQELIKVEVAVLGSPSRTVFVVKAAFSVDVNNIEKLVRAQELCESRGGRPGLPVPNSPNGLCGRKATLNLNIVAT